ncbi:hypothetical protein BC828DRAFT_387840 [Blastocladiella britannica]|nr:hypothetical protein BC828DRAFT_387840 [Blastocladiella britannica]
MVSDTDLRQSRLSTPTGADSGPPLSAIARQLLPLTNLPMDQQLEWKRADAADALQSVIEQTPGATLPPVTVVPSPVQIGYRNMCDFVIGAGMDGMLNVGFTLGPPKSPKNFVEEPTGLKHVNPEVFKAAAILQEFVRSTRYQCGKVVNGKPNSPQNRATSQKLFRVARVRTNSAGHVSVILQATSVGHTPAAVKDGIGRVSNFFTAQAFKAGLVVKVFGIQMCDASEVKFSPSSPIQFLTGSPCAQLESMCGITFPILPLSFFRTNMSAAAELYKVIGDWVRIDHGTGTRHVFLELFSGLGILSTMIANRNDYAKVVAIDSDRAAVTISRALAAAQPTPKSAAIYLLGDVSSVLPIQLDVLQSESHGQPLEITVVADPSHNGVQAVALRALRACPSVRRVVVVATRLRRVQSKFMMLMEPESAPATVGEPFAITRACVVDTAPWSHEYEVVVELRR